MTAQTPALAPSRHRGRNAALWVLQSLAVAIFLFAAVGKFTGAAQIVATFDAIGVGDWLRYLVGALEVAGAMALFISRLAGVAGLAFVGLMTGATITHLVVGSGVALPLAVLLLAAVIAWGRRESTARLWASIAAVSGRGETAA